MPAPVTTDLVWNEIEKRLFAVLSYVTPHAQARSAGIVYIVRGRVLMRGMADDPERIAESSLLEIHPTGDFATYGVGVPLLDMRDPKKARGRAPVTPATDTPS